MPKIIVISAPSGAGKTSLSKELLKINKNIEQVVTHTTRVPRLVLGEKHGVDYYFISEAEFLAHKKKGYFIETAKIYGNFYGTSHQEIDKIIAKNKHALLVIDVQGAAAIRKLNLKKSIFFFIKPPSFEMIAQRLHARGTENKNDLALRLKNYKIEMSHMDKFDEILVNDDLKKTAVRLNQLINTKYDGNPEL